MAKRSWASILLDKIRRRKRSRLDPRDITGMPICVPVTQGDAPTAGELKALRQEVEKVMLSSDGEVCVWGRPGQAKSAALKKMARKQRWKVVKLR